jgi:hypothetical protein
LKLCVDSGKRRKKQREGTRHKKREGRELRSEIEGEREEKIGKREQ